MSASTKLFKLLSIITVSCSTPLLAEEAAPLFNGETLEGWMSWKTKQPLQAGSWEVDAEGNLSLSNPSGEDIYTTGTYGDFELQLEWQSEGNSGILFRINPETRAIWQSALEMQIMNDSSEAKGKHTAGALFDILDLQDAKKVLNPDGWNHVKIVSQGNVITHWLNGEKLYTYDLDSAAWKEALGKSKFKSTKGFASTTPTSIGLQDHGAKVKFRNLSIKKLE